MKNLDVKAGAKLIVTESSIGNGKSNHKAIAESYLKVGAVYTVYHMYIDSWATEVYVNEHPGVAFSSVSFENVEEETKAKVYDKYIAVSNECEQIDEVLNESFPNCEVDTNEEIVIIDGVKHYYYSIDVREMPIDSITIYKIEVLED